MPYFVSESVKLEGACVWLEPQAQVHVTIYLNSNLLVCLKLGHVVLLFPLVMCICLLLTYPRNMTH